MYVILERTGGYCVACELHASVVRADYTQYYCKQCLKDMLAAIETEEAKAKDAAKEVG